MAKKKAKRKVLAIEAKGVKAKSAKRKSKSPVESWEVWTVLCTSFDHGHHHPTASFETKKEAEAWIEDNYGTEDCRCPVIVHINIPPMVY